MSNRFSAVNNLISNRPAAHLALIAGVSGLVYGLVFTLRFPLARFYATIPPIDYTKLTNYSATGLLAYVIGVGVLFLLYLQALRLTAPLDRQPGSGARSAPVISSSFLFSSSAILALISIFAYPLTAIDLFIYAIRTRGWALYGLNPLATAPEQLPQADPWLGLAGEWVDAASPYGPLWEWLSLGTFHLGGGDFLAHLFGLKILAALAYLGCGWLVYKILQHLCPEWATAGVIAFAWNPLVLLESVQNGHNDIVMVFFLLAAVWAFVRLTIKPSAQDQVGFLNSTSRPLLALLTCLFLALSILVKFVTVITVPFFLLGIAHRQPDWLRRLVTMAGYGLIITGLVVLPMLLFWPGWENWAVLSAGSQAGRSLLALLILGLRGFVSTNLAFDLARNLIVGLFGLIYLFNLGLTFRKVGHGLPTTSAALLPILPSFFILFWYVLLAAPVFHAWYLLWFLPLAVLLLPKRRPLVAAIVFSMTALLIIPYFETIRVWYPFLLQNQFLGHLIGVPLLIAPPALALLWPISPDQPFEV